MKKTVNLVSILLAFFMLIGTCFALACNADESEPKSTLTTDIMAYFDSNVNDINTIIESNTMNMVHASDVRVPLQNYVQANEESIQSIIDAIANSDKSSDEKKAMVKNYLIASLTEIIGIVLQENSIKIPAVMFATPIKNIATTYSEKIAEDFPDFFASMISSGALFFILAILVETAVIVFLMFLFKKKGYSLKEVAQTQQPQ